MKLAFRINLLFTGITTCILLGMAVLVFMVSRENVRRDFRQRIRNRAERADYLYNLFRGDTTHLLQSLDANSPPVLFNRNVVIYDTSFQQLYEFHDPQSPEVNAERRWLETAKEKEESFFDAGNKLAGVFYFNRSLLVMVMAEDISGRAYINNLRQVLLVYFPVAFVVCLLAGYLFSRTIVKPVRQTIHDVKLITSQNMSQRLFVGKGKDELAELNRTFNSLLDRLEESFAMEKRFISNASHELSTPLTSISSQVEVALLQQRSTEEYRQVLASVLQDAQSLQQLTRNLLEIAKAGTNGAISLEKVRVDEILFKAHGDILRQYPRYRAQLAFPELPENENDCSVFGNGPLLYSAFKNLIENACKYAPDNEVKISLDFSDDAAIIVFSNRGGIVDSDEMERLFEPFYRGRNAVNRPGVGLGLTLTRRIINLHKGQLQISSDQEGTTARVTLPTLGRAQF